MQQQQVLLFLLLLPLRLLPLGEAVFTEQSWTNLRRLLIDNHERKLQITGNDPNSDDGGVQWRGGIDKKEEEDSEVYSSLRMLQFGSQHFNKRVEDVEFEPFQRAGFLSRSSTAKFFFKFLGFKTHVSVDMNGRDSSMRLDCREDITSEFSTRFDVITNVRFSHYVGGGLFGEEKVLQAQYNHWKSMHDLGAPGAVYLLEVVEHSDELVEPGAVHHSLNFLRALASRCGYHIEEELSYSSTSVVEYFSFPFRNGDLFASSPAVTHTVFWRKLSDAAFMPFEDFRRLQGISVVRERATARFFLALPDRSVARGGVDRSARAEEASLGLCQVYPESLVEWSVCQRFVEEHLAGKFFPWAAEPTARGEAHFYGYIDPLLMNLTEIHGPRK